MRTEKYLLDETRVNAGYNKSKIWVENSVSSSTQAFLDGLSSGLKHLSEKGNRLINCSIGSEDGFVSGGLWAFE